MKYWQTITPMSIKDVFHSPEITMYELKRHCMDTCHNGENLGFFYQGLFMVGMINEKAGLNYYLFVM